MFPTPAACNPLFKSGRQLTWIALPPGRCFGFLIAAHSFFRNEAWILYAESSQDFSLVSHKHHRLDWKFFAVLVQFIGSGRTHSAVIPNQIEAMMFVGEIGRPHV